MCVFVVLPAGMPNSARLIAGTPWYLLSGPMNAEIIIMLVNAVFFLSYLGFTLFYGLTKKVWILIGTTSQLNSCCPKHFHCWEMIAWPSVHSCLQERFHSVWESHQSLIHKVTWRVLPTATTRVRVCGHVCVCACTHVCLCKWKARSWRQQSISVCSSDAAITDTQTWWIWQFWRLVWGCMILTECVLPCTACTHRAGHG